MQRGAQEPPPPPSSLSISLQNVLVSYNCMIYAKLLPFDNVCVCCLGLYGITKFYRPHGTMADSLECVWVCVGGGGI